MPRGHGQYPEVVANYHEVGGSARPRVLMFRKLCLFDYDTKYLGLGMTHLYTS